MVDFPQLAQGFNTCAITPQSLDSIGSELLMHKVSTVGAASAWPAANEALFVPFVVRSPLIAAKMFALSITQNGNADVGIYDDQQNLIVSKGSTAWVSGNKQEFDITDTTLLPGVYYMALASDSATVTMQSGVPAAALCRSFGILKQASAFPLPATATFAVTDRAFFPLFGLTTRTLA